MGPGSSEGVAWYIARDGQQYGPVSDLELQKLVELRHLLPDDFLWRDGFSSWIEAHRIPGLLGPMPPPPPPPPMPMGGGEWPRGTTASFVNAGVVAEPTRSPSQAVATSAGSESTGLALAAYICLLLSIPPLPLIGIVIALVNRTSPPDWLATHFRWQLHTVLKGLLFAVIGLITLFMVVGAFILLATTIWAIVRYVRGISALNRREAITDVGRWGW